MRFALPAVIAVLLAVHVSGKAKPQFQAVLNGIGFAVVVLQYAAFFQQFLRRFLKPLNGIMHRAGYLPRGGLQEKRAVDFFCWW
jgi:CBS domain containing-hemolysin-like protein